MHYKYAILVWRGAWLLNRISSRLSIVKMVQWLVFWSWKLDISDLEEWIPKLSALLDITMSLLWFTSTDPLRDGHSPNLMAFSLLPVVTYLQPAKSNSLVLAVIGHESVRILRQQNRAEELSQCEQFPSLVAQREMTQAFNKWTEANSEPVNAVQAARALGRQLTAHGTN